MLAQIKGSGECVRRLDGWDDAFGATEQPESGHSLIVGDGQVAGSIDAGQPRVLRANAGVIEASRDRVRLDGLAVFVLQQKTAGTMQDARSPLGDGRGVTRSVYPIAGGFKTVQRDIRIVEEGMEDANGVRAAAYARRDGVWQAAGQVEHLLACFFADDLLEVTHHRRERMRPGNGSENVVGVFDVGHPVTHGLIDRILERA